MGQSTLEKLLPLEQKIALNQLKSHVTNEHGEQEAEDEYRLMRFLRARNFDVEKASRMLSNHLEWKKQFNIDDIHNYECPEVTRKYIPRSKRFVDKNGDIAFIFSLGTLDIRGLLKSAKKVDILLTAFQLLQGDVTHMEELTKNTGKVHEQWTYIIDLDHFTLAQATIKEGIELYLTFLKYYEANFPERLKKAIVINASVYFFALYSIIKPLLSQATVNKIKIFAKDGWKDELLKNFDPDQLPAFLGGTVTDPDGNPKCLNMVNSAGLVPESYYIRKTKSELAGEANVKKLNIARRSKATIEVEVTEPGSFIQWKFETAHHDIAFGLSYRKSKTDKKASTELIHLQRIDTQMFSEEGIFQCQETGIYTLVFDNAFSWLRSKELYCRASLILSNGEKQLLTAA